MVKINKIRYRILCLMLAVFIMFLGIAPRLYVRAAYASGSSSEVGADYEKIVNFKRSILLLLVIDITSKTILLNNIARYRFTTLLEVIDKWIGLIGLKLGAWF